MRSGVYEYTSFVTSSLLRLMMARHKDNPLTAELREAQSAHNHALLHMESNALYLCISHNTSPGQIEQTAKQIEQTRHNLLVKVHECLNFVYQTAKAETVSPSPLYETTANRQANTA